MSLLETTLEGTLTADGELRLDGKPDIPPGRVTVVVKALDPPVPGNWWDAMRGTRRKMERAGCRFETDDEIQARIDELRNEEDRIDKYLRGDVNAFGDAEGK